MTLFTTSAIGTAALQSVSIPFGGRLEISANAFSADESNLCSVELITASGERISLAVNESRWDRTYVDEAAR